MSLPTLRETARALKRRLKFYRALLNDPRTPRAAKWCFGLALGYLAMPFDLIPDFIPIIGHLDDAIIVPGLLLLALRLTPQELRDEHEAAPED